MLIPLPGPNVPNLHADAKTPPLQGTSVKGAENPTEGDDNFHHIFAEASSTDDSDNTGQAVVRAVNPDVAQITEESDLIVDDSENDITLATNSEVTEDFTAATPEGEIDVISTPPTTHTIGESPDRQADWLAASTSVKHGETAPLAGGDTDAAQPSKEMPQVSSHGTQILPSEKSGELTVRQSSDATVAITASQAPISHMSASKSEAPASIDKPISRSSEAGSPRSIRHDSGTVINPEPTNTGKPDQSFIKGAQGINQLVIQPGTTRNSGDNTTSKTTHPITGHFETASLEPVKLASPPQAGPTTRAVNNAASFAGDLPNIDRPTLSADSAIISEVRSLSGPLPMTKSLTDQILQQPQLPRHLALQVAGAVQRAGADQPISLLLNPVELGRVKITMTSSDSGVSVMVVADRPETLDLMRRNIDTLAQEFQDIGYGSAEFSFGQSASDNPNDPDPQGQDPSFSIQSTADEKPPLPAPQVVVDRVDIRL